jgi:UPF0271 protein
VGPGKLAGTVSGRVKSAFVVNLKVDLNADLGEGAGVDDSLLQLVTSANVATGFHAGDADSMRAAVVAAKTRGVAIGAHPSLFDRDNFGRKEFPVTRREIFDAVVYQLGALQAIAQAAGAEVRHVKPHGALYNMAAREADTAEAIARAIIHVEPRLRLFAPANSELARAGVFQGLHVVPEVFADRNYLANGALVPRTRRDALLEDSDEAAERVVRMLREGKVRAVDGTDVAVVAETVCVHGDTPGAVEFAKALRARLEREGVAIRAPGALST